MPLKYLNNFWGSFQMPLINYKLELKLRWTRCCVSSVVGTDKANGNNDDNIIFTIKDTKLHASVVGARDNQTSKLLSKGSERSFYWTISDYKNTTNEIFSGIKFC